MVFWGEGIQVNGFRRRGGWQYFSLPSDILSELTPGFNDLFLALVTFHPGAETGLSDCKSEEHGLKPLNKISKKMSSLATSIWSATSIKSIETTVSFIILPLFFVLVDVLDTSVAMFSPDFCSKRKKVKTSTRAWKEKAFLLDALAESKKFSEPGNIICFSRRFWLHHAASCMKM